MDSMKDAAAEPSIVGWYQQQTVFVTGGSGFIGKGLLFKLLQTEVPKIYLLIRTKKGQNPQERLDDILNLDIYENLLKNDPGLRSRTIPIAGDITVDGLGLSESDRRLLQEEVTVVFHVAASVKFDDPLKEAVRYNMTPTRDVVELCRGMKKLKNLQYVSTAFCNVEHETKGNGVEEKIYKRKMDWKKLIEFADTTPAEVVNALEKKILGASLNTYIFTKHLAESIIEDGAEDLNIVITRPAIVGAAISEPLPGWIGNISSPVAIFGAAGKGVLRVYFGDINTKRAYVPLDITVNTIMLATWREATGYKKTSFDKVPIINVDYCPRSAKENADDGEVLTKSFPVHGAIWRMHFMAIENRYAFLFMHLLLHLIPGLFFDAILKLSGRQPMLVKIYRKVYVALNSLRAITNVDDAFEVKNFNELYKVIPAAEKSRFEIFTPKRLDSTLSYYVTCMYGFRRFLKEPPKPTEKDFIHQRRLLILDQAFLSIVMTLFFMFFPYFLITQPLVHIFNDLVHFFTTL